MPCSRLDRERRTIEAMYRIWCRDRHGSSGPLCDECGPGLAYAHLRIGKCPHGEEKPTCRNCTIHCFSPAMKETVREVMRYAGPRMMRCHPVLALLHVLDGLRDGLRKRARPATPSRSRSGGGSGSTATR